MKNIFVYDIETLREMFLMSVYNPSTNEFRDFIISMEGNDMNKMIDFIHNHSEYYWIGYNNLGFDAQVVEYIIRNQEYWQAIGWNAICSAIYQKALDVIDDSYYDILPVFKESDMSFKQVDLFRIWHFNNKHRMVSLKRLAFEMDIEDIEEMPVDSAKRNLTSEEIRRTVLYCHKDIIDTYEFYKITRGDTNHLLYKGKDKINDRFIIEQEIGLRCLNFDDVMIGAEWNKLDYMALTGIPEFRLRPRKVNHFFGRKYKRFFPQTVQFQKMPLIKFVAKVGNTYALNKKQDFVYKFNEELTVQIGKGGIHSKEQPREIVPAKDEIYYQCDIGSQYPNALRKYKLYPVHLGPEWNKMLTSKIKKRLEYKKLAQKTGDPKYQSLQEMLKLSLNGGAYGRLNTKGDWQEDPSCMLRVTMGCQLEILMIVEALLLKGFRVVSVNTDGFDVVVKRNRDREFKQLCKEYEEKIGNDEMGNIEFTEFKWIVQTSVNDYIALKVDGTVKKKGDFTTDFELHRNKSARVVPIALEQYYVHGSDIGVTIRNHTNIYDFCIRQKSSKDFHYEGVVPNASKATVYNKLIRYYVSTKGEKVYKIKNPGCTTGAPQKAQVEAGKWLCTVCNYLPKGTDVKSVGIDYDYYIQRAMTIVNRINTGNRKAKIIEIDKQQLTLW